MFFTCFDDINEAQILTLMRKMRLKFHAYTWLIAVYAMLVTAHRIVLDD